MKRTSLPHRLRDGRRALAVSTAMSLAVGIGAMTASPASATGTTYYVSASGSDSAAGTSTSTPWQSLAKVNATTFQPGDRILFQDGGTWTGQLWPKGSGTSSASITIGSYGSGALPAIAGAGTVPDAVKIWNQQYWTITDLDVSNNAGSAATNLGDFRGIHIGGDDGQTLSEFVVDGVAVHDVTGVVNWIGGSASNDTTGIDYAMGWDRSKDTGGIVFSTSVTNIAAPQSTPTILNGVTVEDSTVKNTSFGGIILKQYTGDAPGAVSTGWGTRTSATDASYAPFTNVTIENNYITQYGTKYGCDGIYITDVRGGTIQNNLINQVGTSGIEIYYTDQVTAQYNEVVGTTVKAGGGDSNALDTDVGNTSAIAQYNYLHNNNVGYLACACKSLGFGTATFRYNVVADNTQKQVQLDNVSGTSTSVYNNTFYETAGDQMVYGSGPTTFTDNIFYTTVAAATMATGSAIVYTNNLYGGNSPTVPSTDTAAVIGDPKFADPTVAGTGTIAGGPALSAGRNWMIPSTSPAVSAGVAIANNGGRDYNGTAVPAVPDIGAFQHSSSLPAPVFSDTFDSLATGALATGTDGWTVTSTGNQVNVVATPSSTDHSVELVRTQNTGGTPGTNMTQTFSGGLTGNFAVGANVMRDSTTSGTGYFCLPYLYDSSGTPVISVAFDNGEIEAYEGTTLHTIAAYTLGTWYRVEVDVDTASQTFTLYVNGVEEFFGAGFRASTSSIGSMAFYANATNYGDAYVNNVTVS